MYSIGFYAYYNFNQVEFKNVCLKYLIDLGSLFEL